MTMLPRLKSVSVAGPATLRLVWASGRATRADLTGAIARLEALAPLENAGIFRQAEIADWGAAVAWPGDIAFSAQSLWRLSQEQSVFSPADFRRWQDGLRLSLAEAADVLGVTPSTVKKYRKTGPIPAPVRIAARVMQDDPVLLAAHFRPRKRGRPRAAA